MISGESSVNTCLGSILTLFLLAGVIFYAYLKVVIMYQYGDTHIMFTQLDYFYDNDYVASDRLGFNIAVGLTKFDDSTEFLEDPYYGTIEAEVREWGLNDRAVPSHSELVQRCTKKEVGLEEPQNEFEDEDEPVFYPVID